MRSLAGAVLILLLAACTKQEPPPASSATAAKPLSSAAVVSTIDQPAGKSALPTGDELRAPPVLTTAMLTTTTQTATARAPSPAPAATSATPGSSDSAAKDPGPAEASTKDGAAIFTQICATCHMADGYGVPYLQPKIKGSAWISNPDPQPLLSLILRGSAILGEASKAYENDMAPQDHLSDVEIAAVASYVRQRFAATPINEPVTPAQVALARSRPGLP